MLRTIRRAWPIALVLILAASPRAGAEERHPMPKAAARGEARAAGGSGGFWFGSAGIAVALAAFGALSLGAKKWAPGVAPGPLKVVGRASLTAKQAVYLVQAGDRVFLVGAGGQGPPSLLGELSEDEVAATPPTPARRPTTPVRVGGAA